MTKEELIKDLRKRAKLNEQLAQQERAIGYKYSWGFYHGQANVYSIVASELERLESV